MAIIMTNLQSRFRDTRIQPYELSKLTMMDCQKDERWRTRDLPRVEAHGLWYPIMLYPVTPEWWHGPYKKWRNTTDLIHEEPVINEDGMIWAIKVGNNRYQCAVHLGYTSIDAIMFDNCHDCIKLGIWLRDCDPLNNSNAPAYTGAVRY